MGVQRTEVRPIESTQISEVATFLHDTLNPAVSVESWAAMLQPTWSTAAPDHGVALYAGDTLVGVYAAVYSEREFAGEHIAVCNLAAFCVREEYRTHALRLVRALLKRPGYLFTDLSPSGNVVALNERLGFQRLNTSTRLVVNVPRARHRGIRITQDPALLEATLTGQDAIVYRDHRTAGAARHLLVQRGDDYAYLVFRADARKRMRLFASPLYAGGHRALLQDTWGEVRSHILLHNGLLFTLAERRILGFAQGWGREMGTTRPKMVRGEAPLEIDYLYSELALVSW